MKYECPACQRVLYNRRLKHCGFCGAPIPEEVRFTPEEAVEQEVKLAELEVQPLKHQHDPQHEASVGEGAVEAGKRRKNECPACQRALYNRRLKNCGFCGAPIPESLRFTPEESAALEGKLVELEAQRLKRQRDAEKEASWRTDGEDPGIPIS